MAVRCSGGIWRVVSSALSATLLAGFLLVGGVAERPGPTAPGELPPSKPVVGSTYLCTGYAGCKNAGYSDAGYSNANDRMYWRMYAGHNCTNYAAYRMIKAGMPDERPWAGGGNATYWGQYMDDVTDQRPAVGAIAWWRAHDGGVGSSGHVAYVEQVVSETEIVISEDSWGGDFHWRRITKDSGRWPTGFIHFVDKSLRNTKAPTVSGTPKVGETLTVDTGAWDPDPSFEIQWLSGGKPIDGATTRQFTPTGAQQGTVLSVRVTAKKKGYDPTVVTSAPTGRVARGELVVAEPPAVTGETMVDEAVAAAPPTVSPRPDAVRYQWRADGLVIDGANDETLTLTDDLVGKQISVTTVATKEGYANQRVTSDRVGPVLIGEIELTEPFTVRGKARVGQELEVTDGRFRPDDADVAYQWLRDGEPIDGAATTSYVLTGDDLGTTVSVQVALSRRNYADRVETVTAGEVTTVPTADLRATGKSRKAVVVVTLQALGVSEVHGTVTIRVGGREVVAELTDGRARAVVAGLQPGERTVRMTYGGRGPVRTAKATTTVRVLR